MFYVLLAFRSIIENTYKNKFNLVLMIIFKQTVYLKYTFYILVTYNFITLFLVL